MCMSICFLETRDAEEKLLAKERRPDVFAW